MKSTVWTSGAPELRMFHFSIESLQKSPSLQIEVKWSRLSSFLPLGESPGDSTCFPEGKHFGQTFRANISGKHFGQTFRANISGKHGQTRANIGKHGQTRANTGKHGQTRANTGKHGQTRANTRKHRQTRANTGKHRRRAASS